MKLAWIDLETTGLDAETCHILEIALVITDKNLTREISFHKVLHFTDFDNMNINGVNSTDNEQAITIEYTGREVLSSGNSSFSRMKGKSVDVGEYFYYKLV
jgi:oligoribonuclease (3'-5' exoribonuclease)